MKWVLGNQGIKLFCTKLEVEKKNKHNYYISNKELALKGWAKGKLHIKIEEYSIKHKKSM